MCSVDGCDKPHRARGFCNTHYMRFMEDEGYMKRWRDANRQKLNERQKLARQKAEFRSYTKEYASDYNKRRRRRLRETLVGHYSNGLNACACCGIETLEFLTLDHIDGGGNEQRRLAGSARPNGTFNTTTFYQWLVNSGYPSGLQVLCFNCNAAKGQYGVCPHAA